MNIGCPWILLLPFHRTAYIGIIGNVAGIEAGKVSGIDLSLWSAVLEFLCIVSCVYLYFNRYTLVWLLTMYILLMYLFIKWYIHFCIFRLYSRHPFLVSLVWFVPGVIYWQVCVANKRIDISCREAMES